MRYFRPSNRPWGPPSLLYNGYWVSLSGVKCGRGVLLTTHPLLVPRSWKSTAIPLPNLWAVKSAIINEVQTEKKIPVGTRFSPVQTGPGAHPASCKIGTGSFPGVKFGRGVLLTTHPILLPRSWKSRAITLPTLWATRGL